MPMTWPGFWRKESKPSKARGWPSRSKSNQVFAVVPSDADDRARATGASYYKWTSLGEETQDEVTLRFVCSWNSRQEDVEALIAALRG